MVADWREDYNECRPHSALGMMAPAKFARAWRARHGAATASLRSPRGLPPRGGPTTTLQHYDNPRLSLGVDR